MVIVKNIAELPRHAMGERGEQISLVNEAIGARHVDVHINVLRPAGPDGRYHYHPDSENIYIVLEGTGRLVAEGQEHILKKDDVVFIPAGAQHSLSARGDRNFVIVEIYAPVPVKSVPVEVD
jgi:quercetin dioxygenase-like cupin family protein